MDPYLFDLCGNPGMCYTSIMDSIIEKDLRRAGIDPSTVTPGSHKRVAWTCLQNHTWEGEIKVRLKGHGCPYCAGQRPIKGETDLATTNPLLAQEWSPNNAVSPDEVMRGSTKKYLWVCSKGHEWSEAPKQRSRGYGCVYCSGKRVRVGETDLATTHPELAAMWSPRNTFQPTDVGAGSNKKAWFVCENNHIQERAIYNAVNSAGCTYCIGRKVTIGENDLVTTHPDIAAEMSDPQYDPTDLSAGSNIKVSWICENGHSWSTTVSQRTRGRGCPRCSHHVSSQDAELLDMIQGYFPDAVGNARGVIPPKELDIYIPSKKIAIEFNGLYWHSDKYRDRFYHQEKYNECAKAGVRLIQIWEDDYRDRNEQTVSALLHKLGVSTRTSIGARKTVASSITTAEARKFLDAYHIQGFASGTYYIGLKDRNNTLISTLVLKTDTTHAGYLNIIRYATSVNVAGGFTKLLSHATSTVPSLGYVTFSDNTISDGSLYRNSGFVVDAELPPDYMYLYRGSRYHKFGFRLKRFKTDPTLRYEEGMTERQLASLNGMFRVYDAGKVRWKLTL